MTENVYKSKASIAYSILRDKIISGEYEYGQILSANSLSEELGMSRTPILEAFKMLENEDVVTVIPQVGVVVKPINVENVLGRFTIQALLEGYLAGETAKKADGKLQGELLELIGLMEDCVRENDSKEYSELNRKFHNTIMDAAGQPYIKDAVLQLYNQNRYVNLRSILFGENMKESLAEHKSIVEAIIQRDEMKARTLMERHILQRRKEYLEKLLKKGSLQIFNE